MRNKVIVIGKNDSGRNTYFKNVSTGERMTRSQFVSQIERNKYPDYHVRLCNNIKTPCSNPDNYRGNNLT